MYSDINQPDTPHSRRGQVIIGSAILTLPRSSFIPRVHDRPTFSAYDVVYGCLRSWTKIPGHKGMQGLKEHTHIHVHASFFFHTYEKVMDEPILTHSWQYSRRLPGSRVVLKYLLYMWINIKMTIIKLFASSFASAVAKFLGHSCINTSVVRLY